MATLLMACSDAVDYKTYEGRYVLDYATLDGIDVTDEYQAYRVDLKENQTMTVFISYLGIISNRQSNYVIEYPNLLETYNNQTYTYRFEQDNQTLVFSSNENDEVLLVYLNKETKPDEEVTGIDFEGILFGEDLTLTKKFNYAPAIITEIDDLGNEVMHIWYCTNKYSAIIMDHIAYRKGVKNEQGKWVFSEETIVLEPTPGTWDSRHVCDPAVIKGAFNYNNQTYQYLMAYLGCTTEDYSNNETGIAVSNSPTGPWIKMNHLNPIVPWNRDNPNGTWGTGMPALISVDEMGEALLFYSNVAVGIGVEHWNFSNLNDPELFYVSSINPSGAKNPNGSALGLAIADFVYDEISGRLYVVSATNTKNPADVTVTRVNSHAILAYVDGLATINDLVNALEDRSYLWNVVGYIGPEETGFERNHNLGIVSDIYGRIQDDQQIMIVVSTGHNSWSNENIFTYRLLGYIYHIDHS